MTNPDEFFDLIFSAMGASAPVKHTFMVDYTTPQMESRYNEYSAYVHDESSVEDAVQQVKALVEMGGNAVCMISEFTGGYTYEQLVSLYQGGSLDEARKHIKQWYVNADAVPPLTAEETQLMQDAHTKREARL